MAEKAPQLPVLENETGILLHPVPSELLRVGILGAFVGLLIPFLGWLLERFFITPILCEAADSATFCASSDLTASYMATAVITVVAVALLVNWQIFRPLLIAVAAAAALWGLRKYISDVASDSALEYYLSSAILYALGYLLFYWLLRLRNFALSVILTVIIVVLVRWALLA